MEKSKFIEYIFIRNIPEFNREIRFSHKFNEPVDFEIAVVEMVFPDVIRHFEIAKNFLINGLLLDDSTECVDWRKRNKIPEFITKYGILEKEIKKWNIKGINR